MPSTDDKTPDAQSRYLLAKLRDIKMPGTELMPCPFCGSENIDPEGWWSDDSKGPACDDCGATAQTIEIWQTRF